MRLGALQDDVGVGPTEAERVHAHGQLPLRLQRQGFGNHLQVEVGKGDVRVKRLDANGGGHSALGQAAQGLHQARRTGGRLQVAEVALDRADRQRVAGATRLAQRFADSARFYRVTHGGTGAMGLQVIQLLGAMPAWA